MTFFKPFFVFLICMFLPILICAQDKAYTGEYREVELVIHTLFDGMREGDSSKVAAVFDKEVSMYTSLINKQGEKEIRKGELVNFLKAIGTPHDHIWDEKIWNTSIQVNEGIAQVWTDYAFYIGTEFSHCGVDAFHLIKDGAKGWKIVHLMDTRRKEDCIILNQ